MSRSRYIRSHGQPGFAAYQDTLPGMMAAGSPDYGVSSLSLLFRLDGMPEMLASPDEFHPLLSVIDYGVAPATNLLAIGVTPSGRIRAENKAGDYIQTVQNFVAMDGRWHYVQVAYDAGAVAWVSGIVDLDTGKSIAPTEETATLAAPNYCTATYFARMVMFGGASGLTRCACSVGYALVGWTDTLGAHSTEWDMETFDSQGRLVTVNPGVWPDGGLYDGSLTLGMLDSAPNANPWGVIDLTADPRQYWSKGLQTIYSRRTRAATPFFRRNVVWLS